MLVVIESHPVQYHAPVYRALNQHHGVPVTAVYGSDFSVAGYHDAEFNATFAWDADLLGGYAHRFLGRVGKGGARQAEDVRALGLAAVLRGLNPSAVLVVGYGSRFNRAAWFEGWRSGVPLLFRGETNDDAIDRSVVKSSVRRAALRVAYGRCGALVYIGQRSRAHFEDLGVERSKLHFSPYCVDVTPFSTDEASRARLRDAARASLDVRADQIVLMFAGKLSQRKGVDLLPAAIAGLPEPLRSKVVLLLVGDGELREAATSWGGAVRAVGFQNQHQLSAFYHAADLCALPSRHGETWGLVVNEALHHGVPVVVSTRVGCAPDLIIEGLTGATCAPDSVPALSDAICRVAALCGREDVRHACRAYVAKYSVDAAAEGLADAYSSVMRVAAV
jgi:glycosyltransferase involved in cell wall biosynthesis